MAHKLLDGRLVVVLLVLVHMVTAAMPCSFNDTAGVNHDLSPMTLSHGAYNYSVGDTTYYVNVCDYVHGTICSACLACMVEHGKDDTFLALSILSFSYNATLADNNNALDSIITIKYSEGFTCGGSEYSTTLKISCGASEGEITNVTFSDCVYTFYMASMYACGNISITTTTSTISSTTSPSSTTSTANSTTSSPTSASTVSSSSSSSTTSPSTTFPASTTSPAATSSPAPTTAPTSTTSPASGTSSTTMPNTTGSTSGSTKDSSTHSTTSATHSTTTGDTGGFTSMDKDLMITVLAILVVLFVMCIVLCVLVVLLYRRVSASFPALPPSGYSPISINDDRPPPPSNRSTTYIPALASAPPGKRVSIRDNPDWEKTWDEEEKRHYYHNKVTGESKWSEDD